MLNQMVQQGEAYLRMIDSVSGDGAAKPAAEKAEDNTTKRRVS